MKKKVTFKEWLQENYKHLAIIGLNVVSVLLLNKKINKNRKDLLTVSGNCNVDAGAINDVFVHLGMDEKFFIIDPRTGERFKGVL